MPYEQLNQSGFKFTRTSVAMNLSTADCGDGYEPPSSLIGNPEGLRSWTIRIDALPNSTAQGQAPAIDGKTRANYLWDFFLASKNAGNKPFWIEDPKDGKFYLACFVANDLDYEILCSFVFATGLELRQRRVTDQSTPVTEIPS